MKRLLFRLFLISSSGITVALSIPLIFLIVFLGYRADNFFFWQEPECVEIRWESEDAGGEVTERYGLSFALSSPDSASNVYCKVSIRHRGEGRLGINLDAVEARVLRHGKMRELVCSPPGDIFPLTFPECHDTPEKGFASATELTVPLKGDIRPERWSDVLRLTAEFTVFEGKQGKAAQGKVSCSCKSFRTGEIFR